MNKKINLCILSIMLAGSALGFAGIKLTRGGYESPEYTSKKHANGFEVRSYSSMTIVSTRKEVSQNKNERDSRFMRLFKYIDKSNAKSKKIAMTTPVFMGMEGKEGEMSFVIPKKVASEGAPAPDSDSLQVKEMKPVTFAAMRFRGKPSKESSAAIELIKKVKSAGLEIEKNTKPIFAYYDPPWIPVFFRKNEVLIKIVAPKKNIKTNKK
ncbi:MAG: SOUL family heme-binding protein [Verrucomicrobiales bacterium]|nr:heme-binding protein [Lentisphaeraceae bacterium]OUU87730.1 MAG: hypothetical protein CBC36_06510 [Verrucomicrobiaceae bacterium TMED76]